MAGELRKTILETDDIVSVLVPEWGGITIEVRAMNGKERAKLLKGAAAGGEVNMEKWFPDLLIATVHDPTTGEKVFEPADRDAINAKSGAAIAAIADVSARLSGLGESDLQAAKEELSSETPKLDST